MCSLTLTTSAFTPFFLSAAASAFSVVVPGMTATFLPPRSATRLTADAVVTRRLPPSTKVMLVKSTRSWRESVLVVDPHSMSTVPLATDVMRSSGVTGTHFTLRLGRPSCCWTEAAIRLQRSTEYPAGFFSRSTNENGTDDSR